MKSSAISRIFLVLCLVLPLGLLGQGNYEVGDRGGMGLGNGRIAAFGFYRGWYKTQRGGLGHGTVVHITATDCKPFKIGPRSIFQFQGKYYEVVTVERTIKRLDQRGRLFFKELEAKPDVRFIAN